VKSPVSGLHIGNDYRIEHLQHGSTSLRVKLVPLIKSILTNNRKVLGEHETQDLNLSHRINGN
jgi:hypothetical protein